MLSEPFNVTSPALVASLADLIEREPLLWSNAQPSPVIESGGFAPRANERREEGICITLPSIAIPASRLRSLTDVVFLATRSSIIIAPFEIKMRSILRLSGGVDFVVGEVWAGVTGWVVPFCVGTPATVTPVDSLMSVTAGLTTSSSVTTSFLERRAERETAALSAPTESDDFVPAGFDT